MIPQGAGQLGATGAAGVQAPAVSAASGYTAGQKLIMLSTGLGAASSILGGIAAQRQGRFEAGLAERNAALEAARLDVNRRRRMGLLRAQIGASGTSLSGSNLDVLVDQEMAAEQDRLLVLFGGRQRAAAARYQGTQGLASGLGRAAGQGIALLGQREIFKRLNANANKVDSLI